MNYVQFNVEIGYKRFIFKTIEEAILFAVTAKKTSADEEESICIHVEWVTEQEEE